MEQKRKMRLIASDGTDITFDGKALADLDDETLYFAFEQVPYPGNAGVFPNIAQAYMDAQQAIMAEAKKRGIFMHPSVQAVG